MGMSKEQKKLFADITATLADMKKPSAAQTYLDNQAMEAGKFFESGDYRKTPNNLFLSIEDPAIENQRRKTMMDSQGDGVSALASGAGDATALALNKDYLNDKWSRDSASNYQNQIADASQNTLYGLGGSASATQQRQNALLNGQMSALSNAPKSPSLFGSLIAGGLSLAGKYFEGGGIFNKSRTPLQLAMTPSNAIINTIQPIGLPISRPL